MDPLSAIASVVGIISAASQVAAVLGPYARAGKEAPKIVAQLHSETLATKTVLTALEQLTMVLSKIAAISSITYASLIQIDELRAVLTDGVLLFSELESLVDTLPPLGVTSQGARLLASIQWTRKRGALLAVLARLQSFKVSINCILSILQSDSQARAESHQQQLIQNVNEILRNSQTLTQMMLGADDVATTLLDAPRPRASIESQSVTPQNGGVHAPVHVPRGDRRPRMSLQSTRSLYSMHFETELKGSRVYRLAKRMSMDFSMRSSVVGTHAWSVFSGLSLGEISNISVLALPIFATDITNPQHYHFGLTMATVKEHVIPASVVSEWHANVLKLLSELPLYPFANLVAEEKRKATSASKDDSLSTLIAVFRHGLPLLAILDYFDDSLHDEWDSLSSETWMQYRPGTVGEAAVAIFAQACVDHLSLARSECFTISELMDADIDGQIKVANVIRDVLDKLVATGNIPSGSPVTPASNQDSPYFTFFNTYLSDQWLYLSRLEDLLAVKEKLPPPGIPLNANEIQALDYLFIHLGALVDVQRRFLLGLENVDLIPYRYQNGYLNRVFREWSDAWGEPFVGFLSCRDPGDSAAQTLRRSANRELQGLLGEGLRLVDRSEWPFSKHEKFLEELREFGYSGWFANTIESAQGHSPKEKSSPVDDDMEAKAWGVQGTENIRRAARVAEATQAAQDLYHDLERASEGIARDLGRVLLSDLVTTMRLENGSDLDTNSKSSYSTQSNVQAYLFEHAILHVTPDSGPHDQDGMEPHADSTGRAPATVQIIWAEDIVSVRETSQVCHTGLDKLELRKGYKLRWIGSDDVSSSLFGSIMTSTTTDAGRLDLWIQGLETITRREGD
ncbi:hypothetical protein B0T22DRAFT_212242 [Podospora appendiculata]|uniref:Cdc24/Scd1 N-terminal domain-containing protein n=1 Tax=Podospora appendiculata TaxID=314037 RepID=A0AAE0X4W1_9PEZI|nr:hypothetical protein B0T22DRAFT_212242 [Podospora appendiculata]